MSLTGIENFLPKIDGVTRTLARLLDHLREKGHEALIVGPDNGLVSPLYALDILISIDVIRWVFSTRHTGTPIILLPRAEMEFPLNRSPPTDHRLQTRCNPFR